MCMSTEKGKKAKAVETLLKVSVVPSLRMAILWSKEKLDSVFFIDQWF